MSYTATSAEVADDFKDALQDLTINDRAQINNLMIIAKENTEHAQAISRELVNHIKTTRPEFKLPALYVLDAIVKFVGTPYTVYLSRDLYKTFMEAYSLMAQTTRRAMDNLLQTWKAPPPESMEKRPVFPPEITRDIENALIKIRTITVQSQQQQQQQRTQRPMQNPLPARPGPGEPWRNTPTPPQNSFPQSHDPRVRQITPQQHGISFASPYSSSTPANGSQQIQPISSAQLLSEVDKLVTVTRTEWMQNFQSQELMTKLKALVDLQTLLKSQQLSDDQLRAIRDQLLPLTPSTTPNTAYQAPQPFHRPGSVQPPPQIQVQPPSASLSQFLQPTQAPPAVSANPINLAQLLQSSTPQTQTPPVTQPPFQHLTPLPLATPATSTPVSSAPAPNSASSLSLAQMLQQFAPQSTSTTPKPPDPRPLPTPSSQGGLPPPGQSPSWLLDALKSQNILSTGGSPNPAPPQLPTALHGFLGSGPMARVPSVPTNTENDVQLNTASITKHPRPYLIARLYGALPNQCSTCGRRFPATDAGRAAKAKHMDWHFKVKDPDIAKRGVHRSWYVGEREWIEYREVDESNPSAPTGTSPGGVTGGKPEPAERYIRVPAEITLQNAPCPICQERFEKKWLVQANDFVWMDAVKKGGKVYHASCWEEVNKGMSAMAMAQQQAQQRAASATPDSVLGKRKAEEESGGEVKRGLWT
ncbi:hypothetical protein EJ05DRAFT_122641 [Pseudovirgaria hyperparasitica]|uniref:CID domain-containing protein n=1 Tax=Pseudovirgaria hyperparasitica TaxID=470096 RepID=A0A6A6VWY6_9PEZI|nr:uncharacterized protein EJ05DRAFT_122641 [Pseudovirgaria hyperparasitica]KAF2755102.1 hypothetical protein EJ05DRAFT_122641 [Pseudovirgaria hyperparasitica]